MDEECPAQMSDKCLRVRAVARASYRGQRNFVISVTAVEQVAHVGEVAREQVQWQISWHSLLSESQVSLGSIDSAHECFLGQVA